jgi:hypothetical protein
MLQGIKNYSALAPRLNYTAKTSVNPAKEQDKRRDFYYYTKT